MTLAPDSIEALCKRDPPKKTRNFGKPFLFLEKEEEEKVRRSKKMQSKSRTVK